MIPRARVFAAAAVILAVCAVRGAAQTAPQRARLVVTVADPSGAIIPGATVTLIGLENATKAAAVPPAKSDEQGIVTFDRLVLGRYAIRGEFPGFELGLVRDARLRAGDNKHLVILPLKQMAESVTVSQDARAAASSRPSIGLALTREQIELLSDDPEEMQRQLQEMAGPNARFRVDSFEGSQLPPKAQIKSVHITRDQYAAESHYVGELFIDIVTQPGMGKFRASGGLGYNGTALNSRTALQPKKGPEQNRNFSFSTGGTLIPRRTDFTFSMFGNNNYSTPYLNAAAQTGGGARVETLNVRTPFKALNMSGSLNHALTRDQTIKISAGGGTNSQENLGVGSYSYPERAFSIRGHNYSVTFQEVGPIGRRFFINTRGSIRGTVSRSDSAIEAPTIVVTDAFNSGGAQRSGGTRTRSLVLQSDLDYIRGIHSWRAGVQIEGGWYHSDDQSNYLGTYTFTSMENYLAGKPIFFSKRIGDPTIEYSNVQGGIYVQDDIRVSKSLTLSPGLRYELQTHVTDYNGLAPRFGMTWSPFKSGKTTLRGGGGIFYDWLSTATYAQTIRVDGFHQRDLTITNPTYPDPGDVGKISLTNRYLFGSDYVLPRNAGMNISLDQSITSRIRFSASYNYSRASQVARGSNLNAPVNGVRPDGRFLNVIETVSDAQSRQHSFSISSGFSLVSGPAAMQPRINWKRWSFNGFYSGYRVENNSDGAFSVPASGLLDTEWGPALGRPRNSMNLNITSSVVKNVSMGGGLNLSSGAPYNITTGVDNNGDQMLNDRPVGVSRNSASAPNWTRAWSARFGYTWTFGRGPTGATTPQGVPIPVGILPAGVTVVAGPGGVVSTGRYRLSLNISATNVTNRSNYGGYTGVMTSPFFGKPNSSGAGRRIQISTNFGF